MHAAQISAVPQTLLTREAELSAHLPPHTQPNAVLFLGAACQFHWVWEFVCVGLYDSTTLKLG